MAEVFLRIGEMTIALRCERDAERLLRLEGPTLRFVTPSSVISSTDAVDVDIAVRFDDIAPFEGKPVFDSGSVWTLYRDGSTWRIECRSVAFGDGPYKVATFDEHFTRGEIVIRRDVDVAPLDYPLDEVLIANLLGRGRGVELHSCGVIDQDGRGHLFVGVSGAGKTTTARLWERQASGIVSDDRVIVREHQGAMWMFGTPWHGEAELSMQGGAPLAGVYLLVQAESNELRTISEAEAVARLFGCAFPLFYDAAALDFTLSFLGRLYNSVPVRELRFVRDASVVQLVREAA